jgi:hypothetical protein
MSLKYIDRNGLYRHFALSSNYEIRVNPQLVGTVNNFGVNLDSVGSTKNIGYKSDKIFGLVAESVNCEELELLKDIYTSPRVYLKVNGKWLLVDIKGDNINKTYKGILRTIRLEATIKATNNITML